MAFGADEMAKQVEELATKPHTLELTWYGRTRSLLYLGSIAVRNIMIKDNLESKELISSHKSRFSLPLRESQGRIRTKELMKPWRRDAQWLAWHGLLSIAFPPTTQDHLPQSVAAICELYLTIPISSEEKALQAF